MSRKKKIKKKGITRNLQPSAEIDVSMDLFFEDFISHIKLIKKLNSEGVKDSQISDILESVESSLRSHFEVIDQLESNLKEFSELEITKSNFSSFFQDLKKILENVSISIFKLLKPESEEEFVKNIQDITGILQILYILTQKINISSEKIKENIQLSLEEILEKLEHKFREFTVRFIETGKEIKKITYIAPKNKVMLNLVNKFRQKLTLFNKKADSIIDQMIRAALALDDTEMQQISPNIESYVQDLMELLENLDLRIRELTISEYGEEFLKHIPDITSILQILNMLTQNISFSVENIETSLYYLIGEKINSLVFEFKKLFVSRDEWKKLELEQQKKYDLRKERVEKERLEREQLEKERIIREELERGRLKIEDIIRIAQEKLKAIKELETKKKSLEKILFKIKDKIQEKTITETITELKNIIDVSKTYNFKEVLYTARDLLNFYDELLNIKNLIEKDQISNSIIRLNEIIREATIQKYKDVINQANLMLDKEIIKETKKKSSSIEDLIKEEKFETAVKELNDLKLTAKKNNLNDTIDWVEQKLELCTKLKEEKIRMEKMNIIKKTILDLGIKFGRLQIMEISEVCSIKEEQLIIDTIKEMIDNKEIYAQYFSSTKSVAFDQQANIDEIDKLMSTYRDWEDKKVGKK